MEIPDDKLKILRRALRDAIDWQQSLADAWREGTPERSKALDLVKEYKKILESAGGTIRDLLADAKAVDIDKLRKTEGQSNG